MGTVYLIHFDAPLGNTSNPRGQAQHWHVHQSANLHFDGRISRAQAADMLNVSPHIGYTDNLAERIETHRRGNGAAIMAAVCRAGIGWEVVRTWAGGRDLERRLKRRKKARCLCPICQKEAECETSQGD